MTPPHSQIGVQLTQKKVDLLKKVLTVLEPFYRATVQLSHESACVSEVRKYLLAKIPLLTKLTSFMVIFWSFVHILVVLNMITVGDSPHICPLRLCQS